MSGGPLHPLFLRLRDKTVLVVGGGPVALEKTTAVLRAGALPRVVSPRFEPAFDALAIERHERPFEPSDVAGAWLVIAAATPEVNRAAALAAEEARVWIVAVDDPAVSHAFGAATFERAGITVALSSNGEAPALVALLRRALEAVLPDDVERWAQIAREARVAWKRDGTPLADRRPLLLRALLAHEGGAP
jgi:siroheme synthase-like protein